MDLLSRLFILTIFSPMKENKTFSDKCIDPKQQSDGNSFTDLGYNIGQVETLLGYINHCVF